MLADAQGRIFAVKVSAPGSQPLRPSMAQSMNDALNQLAKAVVRRPGGAAGREAWGILSVSFGLTMGAGSQVRSAALMGHS